MYVWHCMHAPMEITFDIANHTVQIWMIKNDDDDDNVNFDDNTIDTNNNST